MADVLDEATADKQVIKSLLRHIRKIEGHMAKLLFDEAGNLYLAHHYEAITTDELDKQVSTLQADIDSVTAVKHAAASLSTPAATEPVTAPIDVPAPTPITVTDNTAPVESQPVAATPVAAEVATDSTATDAPAPITLQ